MQKALKNRSGLTEVKFENTINRLTAIANPRQIERVVRGSEFGITLVYDMEEESELLTDFSNIAKGFKLLSMDYLGGHGSRGYGKVAFSDFQVEVREGSSPVELEALLEPLRSGKLWNILFTSLSFLQPYKVKIQAVLL